MDTGAVYARQRRDISEVLDQMAEGQELLPVPGCPAWRVRELLSHLAGLPADIVEGRVDGAGSDPWTAAQVAAREDRTVAELREEWAEHAPFVEEHATAWGPGFTRIAFDITLHGDDLREALGLPLGATPDHAEVLDGLVARVDGALREAGAPAMRIVAGSRDVVVGDGDPTASLRVVDEGELGRVLGGRRTDVQLRAMDWDGDPEPYLPHLPLFGPRRE